MSEASWISPDEGLTATGLARPLLVIKDIGKLVSTQNHYFSTKPLLDTKFPGKDKIREVALLSAVCCSGSVCSKLQKQGHVWGTRSLIRPSQDPTANKVVMAEPKLPSESSEQNLIESLPAMTLEQWLEKLRRSDRAFYNIMAIEVWSIAKTMDSLIPGFWGRFMTNRRLAMKQFVEQRRLEQPTPETDIAPSESSPNP